MLMMARSDQAPDGKSLLVCAETVAVMLGVSVKTVSNWHLAGKLPKPVRLDGPRRWRRADIEAWVAAGCDKKIWKAKNS
jgi:predicted DNA-binding transcriptional regulator AlpA